MQNKSNKTNVKNTELPSLDLSPRKRRIYTILVILLPLLFLLFLEILLRLFNYGGNLDLFISGPGRLENYYICNPRVAARYFIHQKILPTPPNDYFEKHKPDNGYRVFVLGGSTTNGYPYGYNLMFSRILEARLKQSLPDRTVEVVNVSMSAVNSYTLLDFIDEIVEQKPDAILIYAGHNEYYGALGAASMINFGRNRSFIVAYMRLGRLKIFAIVRDFVLRLKKFGKGDKFVPTATLMERMVAEQSIPLDSPLYLQGVSQFENNLNSIFKKIKRKNIPCIVSELVSNISDLAPFVSQEEAESALSVFNLAKTSVKNQNYEIAKKEYKRAKDLDVLRFRAPSSFNDVIHKVASQYDIPVVAMESQFEQASPHGLIGDNLMMDHLHPNIEGYFLMAEAFYREMINAGLVELSKFSISLNQLQQSWGYTRIDSLYGALGVQVLKSGWPFQPFSAPATALDNFQPKDYVEEIAVRVVKYDNVQLWEGHKILAEHFEKNKMYEEAFREYMALITIKDYSALPYLKVSEKLVKTKDVNRVPQLVSESLLFDESPLPYVLLGEAYNIMGEFSKALIAFQHAQELGLKENDPHVLMGLINAYNGSGQFEKENAVKSRNRATLQKMGFVRADDELNQLFQSAQQFIREKKYDEALEQIEKSLSIQETGPALLWKGQIYLHKKQLASAIACLEKARQYNYEQPLLLYNLCIAYVQVKAYEKAWTTLQELEKIDANFDDPYDLKNKLAQYMQSVNQN